jgi:signal transduction histidine kinase
METHAGIFKSILRNLLDNSNKYTPGGRIHLKVCQVGAGLLVQVEDSGSGLPDDILQIYGSKNAGEGEWVLQATAADEIGLNLILRFTRMLNGRLTYRNDASGSTFSLHLPL